MGLLARARQGEGCGVADPPGGGGDDSAWACAAVSWTTVATSAFVTSNGP